MAHSFYYVKANDSDLHVVVKDFAGRADLLAAELEHRSGVTLRGQLVHEYHADFAPSDTGFER